MGQTGFVLIELDTTTKIILCPISYLTSLFRRPGTLRPAHTYPTMSSKQERILSLKRQALELRDAGDLVGAKKALEQMRATEFEGVSSVEDFVDSASNPAVLKRLAVHLKGRGDLDGARSALMRAKAIDSGGGYTGGGGGAAASAAVNPTAAVAATRPRVPAEGAVSTPKETVEGYNKEMGGDSASFHDATVVDEDGSDEGRSVSEFDEDDDSDGPVTFSVEDMLDAETMCEMKDLGMDVPSEEDYRTQVMIRKRAAVAFKQQGKISQARAALIEAKRLEAAAAQLAAYVGDGADLLDEDDQEAWMDDLRAELGGDYDGELFGLDDGTGGALDLDELDDLDSEMLREMMDAGMEVPDPDEVLNLAREKKALAVALKKDNNIAGAKAALAESKCLQSRGENLQKMLAEITAARDGSEGNVGDAAGNLEALEAILNSEDGGDKRTTTTKRAEQERRVQEVEGPWR